MSNFLAQFTILWSHLIPRCCVLCDARINHEVEICLPCQQDLPLNTSTCSSCATPLTTVGLCGRCLLSPPPYERCIAPYQYHYPLDALIKALKFGGQLRYATQLGHLLLSHIEQQSSTKPDCLIPIPLHPDRLRERGYNQALEIARPIAKHFNIPIDTDSFQRHKATAPQAMLAYTDRANNIQDAFVKNKEFPYKHAVVIDDVITTGATIAEFCKTILQSSDARIEVWALARAILAP